MVPSLRCCAIFPGMAQDPKLLDADYWRSRAEEARAMAASMNDPNSKRVLIGIAEGYDRLAEMAERAAAYPTR